MRVHKERVISCFIALSLLCVIVPQAMAQHAPVPSKAKQSNFTYLSPGPEAYNALAKEVDATLRRDVLDVWFPRTVDNKNGGFYADFTRDWQPAPSQGKFSVFQGRMTWVAAQIAMRRPDLKDQYLPIAQHGVNYLSNTIWDKQYGGFYWGLGDDGKPSPAFDDGKHLYGISFCLYGLAAAYQATHDPKTLALAQETFRWIDQHAHDARNGGYFEWLTREGKIVEGDPNAVVLKMVATAGFPIGYKSMNTHIHLLESFAQLYEVWKDYTLHQRLEELLAIVRDKVCVEPGVMNLYFTTDWRPIPDHDSYGHDIETAYLMLEASEVLGHEHDAKTERMAKMLVDHTMAYAWDDTYGGIYNEGTTFGKPEDTSKQWWQQVESLNALLMMHEKYGKENPGYFKLFQRQWDFIKNRQIDEKYRGLYAGVERDGKVASYSKAQMWKAAYHDGRAFLNVTARLQKLAAESAK